MQVDFITNANEQQVYFTDISLESYVCCSFDKSQDEPVARNELDIAEFTQLNDSFLFLVETCTLYTDDEQQWHIDFFDVANNLLAVTLINKDCNAFNKYEAGCGYEGKVDLVPKSVFKDLQDFLQKNLNFED